MILRQPFACLPLANKVVMLKADDLLSNSTLPRIEVWQEERFVGRPSIAPDLKVIVGGKDKTGP